MLFIFCIHAAASSQISLRHTDPNVEQFQYAGSRRGQFILAPGESMELCIPVDIINKTTLELGFGTINFDVRLVQQIYGRFKDLQEKGFMKDICEALLAKDKTLIPQIEYDEAFKKHLRHIDRDILKVREVANSFPTNFQERLTELFDNRLRCFMCLKTDTNALHKCSGCERYHYCSKKCQKDHWERDAHKLDCPRFCFWKEVFKGKNKDLEEKLKTTYERMNAILKWCDELIYAAEFADMIEVLQAKSLETLATSSKEDMLLSIQSIELAGKALVELKKPSRLKGSQAYVLHEEKNGWTKVRMLNGKEIEVHKKGWKMLKENGETNEEILSKLKVAKQLT